MPVDQNCRWLERYIIGCWDTIFWSQSTEDVNLTNCSGSLCLPMVLGVLLMKPADEESGSYTASTIFDMLIKIMRTNRT